VALLVAALGPRAAAAEPPGVDVPVGIPVQLDGRMLPGEWSDAASLPVGTEGASVRVKQVRGMLLLALDVPGPWPKDSHWMVFAGPDADNAGAHVPGSVSFDFEPLEHNRPHLLVERILGGGLEAYPGHAIARGDVHGLRATVEMAVRLEILGVTESSKGRKRVATLLARPGAGRTLTWPEGLDLGARAGAPPPDLVSSAKWGRFGGWKEPGGPGAFPKTEWDALIAAESELTEKGSRAHAAYLEIDEERDHMMKRDRELGPTLVDGLLWIAEREPLTAQDLMALAAGYRFLNRKGEALGVLEGLAGLRDREYRTTGILERAKVLETMERYEEAAALWTRIGEAAPAELRSRYAALATRAKERGAAREAERAVCAREDARGNLPLVLLRTSRGDVLVTLFPDDVPKAVAHFLALARLVDGKTGKRFYDGTLFHRVIGDFLAQGGDPKSRDEGCEAAGSGTSPTTVEVETNKTHGFWRGAVGFARGLALTNGSQFFVLTAPRPEFTEEPYTCFGRVVAGMEVVDRLEQCDALLSVEVIR
jgi:cyclophilin family peptidyl-prolyl cis-trans isomerase